MGVDARTATAADFDAAAQAWANWAWLWAIVGGVVGCFAGLLAVIPGAISLVCVIQSVGATSSAGKLRAGTYRIPNPNNGAPNGDARGLDFGSRSAASRAIQEADMPIEAVVLAVLKGVPDIVRNFRQANNESDSPIEVEDRTLVPAIPAMWLFLLCEKLNGSGAVGPLHRAFQAMWSLLPEHGIDVHESRRWFNVFNDTLLLPTQDGRIEMIASAFAKELGQPELGETGCPAWLLAYLVSTSLTTMDKFRIV